MVLSNLTIEKQNKVFILLSLLGAVAHNNITTHRFQGAFVLHVEEKAALVTDRSGKLRHVSPSVGLSGHPLAICDLINVYRTVSTFTNAIARDNTG